MSLPKGWINVHVKDITDINPRTKDIDDDVEASFVPMALLSEDFGIPAKDEVKPWGKIKKGYTHFKNGDVVLAKITPCFENGKAAIIDNLSNGIGSGSTEFFVFRTNPKLMKNKYLYSFFKTKLFSVNATANMSGSVGHRRVPKDYIADFVIPLPPINEQKRIAQKLDELLTTVESIKTRLDNAPTIIKRFRQSILAAATSGKLTEEWREENGVTEDWEELTVDDVARVGTGNTPLKSNTSFYEKGNIPWLTSSVTGNPFVYEADKFVTQKAIDECRLKLYGSGTLLVAMYGEGKTRGQVTELTFPASINQACAAIIVNEDKIVKSYLKMRLQENYAVIRMLAEGGNQPNLNLSKVRSITVPTPSTDEQKEIVSQVESLFELADTLESKIEAAKKRVDKLTQSILAKAFRGELVPQDPNDESAEKLLDRIKSEN